MTSTYDFTGIAGSWDKTLHEKDVIKHREQTWLYGTWPLSPVH